MLLVFLLTLKMQEKKEVFRLGDVLRFGQAPEPVECVMKDRNLLPVARPCVENLRQFVEGYDTFVEVGDNDEFRTSMEQKVVKFVLGMN